MPKPSAEFVQSILARESVRDAVEAVAAHGESPLSANFRAEEALRVAVEIAQVAGREIDETPDGGGYILASIAIAAVRTLDPEQDKLHLRHTLVSWFGPANVPTNLRFSWEGKGKKPTPASDEISPARAGELVDMQNAGALADKAVLAYADVYKALGRIEGMDFLRRVGDVAIAQTFVEVRESKAYKGLPYKDAEGNLRHVEDFDEFCKAFFGKSYTRCYELSKNLHILGPDLYESAERIGFKARDYAALKALPESEQEVVKQALAAESKEQVLDILQDLAARNQSERAAAKAENENLKADLDARDKLLTDKSERLDKVSMDLEKLRSLPPNKRARLQLEQEQAAAERINAACVKAEGALAEFLAEVADVLALDGVSMTSTTHAMNAVRFLGETFADTVATHNIDLDFEGMVRPEWRRDLAAEDLGLQEGK